ncbi:MAG: CotH kinase family protein [Saprospiraceae bacterium]
MSRLLTKSNGFHFYLLITFVIILGCAKNEPLAPTEEEQDNSLVFESFVFEQKNNPNFKKNVVFDIHANTINGPLKHYYFNAIPTFTTNATSVEINEEEQVSGSSSVDFRKGVTYTLKSATGTFKKYTIIVAWDNKLPQVNISTDGRVGINSKTNFIPTKITIDGQSKYNDYTGRAQIRGRGNSTWTFPKKSYKFKLDEDSEILGLKAEKDWVLLANFLDGTHLLNAVAMKIGQLLKMSYTNTIIPVELTLNGEFLGTYMLTEQIEVKKNRVNTGKDGLLLSLDTNFDEPYQFQSASYRLPVTIKYPKEIDASKKNEIRKEFEAFEALIADANFPNNEYLDYFDETAFVQYLIVYMLTGNEEINHPKSTYIHKIKEGKYTMGPIWDFDWAFAFEGSLEHFSSFDIPLFWTSSAKGTQFFSRFLADPAMKALLKTEWAAFQANQLPELLTYIDEYAFIIRGARTRDFVIWAQGKNNYDVEVANLKNWLSNRGRWMNGVIGAL